MVLRSLVFLVAAAAVTGLAPVLANEPVGTSSPIFKRVKPPAAGSTRRINVQISPEEHAAAPVAGSTGRPGQEPIEPDVDGAVSVAAVTPKPGASYDWFWDKVSPELASAGTSRFDDAMRAVSGGAVAAPRLQALQDIAKAQGADILRSTIGTQVSPALVLAVIAVESSGKADAVSVAGAQGLMQLMPATAERFGVHDSLSPKQNIKGGVKYLDWLLDEFDNDPVLALAGYNSGEGSVRTHSGVPPFAETRDYVPKVLAAFQIARGLCMTPPQLVSDGCVFKVMN